MAGRKCVECGLVNWADAESCKRCREPLGGPGGRDEQRRELGPFDAPLLGSFNGIGTRLLGWTHHGDGTARATVWFTFVFLPVFPLSRYELDSPRASDFEPRVSVGQALQGLGQDMRLTTSYRFTGRLPLSGGEVLGTYLYAYLWLPLKVFAPLALLVAGMRAFLDFEGGSATPVVVCGVLLLAWLGYVLFVMATLLHGSRGGGAG
jgi:hypothetical protein